MLQLVHTYMFCKRAMLVMCTVLYGWEWEQWRPKSRDNNFPLQVCVRGVSKELRLQRCSACQHSWPGSLFVLGPHLSCDDWRRSLELFCVVLLWTIISTFNIRYLFSGCEVFLLLVLIYLFINIVHMPNHCQTSHSEEGGVHIVTICGVGGRVRKVLWCLTWYKLWSFTTHNGQSLSVQHRGRMNRNILGNSFN